MTDKNDFIERRKIDRFKIMDGAFAAVKSDHYIVGPIQNISEDGLTLRYFGKSGQMQDLIEIDIFFCGMGFYLQNVRSKTISDFRMDKKVPDSSLTIRQCSVQFCELTDNQIYLIHNFIQNFATRRSDKDRRKLPGHPYGGLERRKGVERRKMMESPF